jgi:hypothetical protein
MEPADFVLTVVLRHGSYARRGRKSLGRSKSSMNFGCHVFMYVYYDVHRLRVLRVHRKTYLMYIASVLKSTRVVF